MLAARFVFAGMITLIIIFATISVSWAAEQAKKPAAELVKDLLGLGRSKE